MGEGIFRRCDLSRGIACCLEKLEGVGCYSLFLRLCVPKELDIDSKRLSSFIEEYFSLLKRF